MLSKWHAISAVLKMGNKPMKTFTFTSKKMQIKNDLTYVGDNICKEQKDLQILVLARV